MINRGKSRKWEIWRENTATERLTGWWPGRGQLRDWGLRSSSPPGGGEGDGQGASQSTTDKDLEMQEEQMWQVTGATGHKASDMWHMTHDSWHVKISVVLFPDSNVVVLTLWDSVSPVSRILYFYSRDYKSYCSFPNWTNFVY